MTYEKIVAYVEKALKKKSASGVTNSALQVDIFGEGEGAFYIEAKDGIFNVQPYEYYNHTAKLIVSADELIGTLDGKIVNPAFQLDGNVEQISALINAVFFTKSVPTKKAAASKKTAPAKKAEAPKKAAPVKKAEAPKK